MAVTKVTDAMRNVTAVDATKISGAVPSASLTNVDLSKLEYNQAILAFKIASANQLAKFQMVDQVIDEYQDATGIDAGASTNESAGGATTAKYYEGGSVTTPTVSLTGSGNTSTVVGDYTVHKFIIDGTYTTDTTQDVEYLVVGGGGGGGTSHDNTGGGGAGAMRTATGFSLPSNSSTPYTIQVGIGGTAGGGGESSIFSSITADGGGKGGNYSGAGSAGGSGGGASATYAAGATTNASYGNAGGTSISSDSAVGGGGGGAGGAGQNGGTDPSGTTKGDGGAGLANSITGSPVTYAAGGGGGSYSANGATVGGSSGIGGDGGRNTSAISSTAGDANTGSGGGGGYHSGSAGGSGIVIIRRLTSSTVSGGNLTLQSVATTAESAPTTADLVMLIEDNEGTATINTDIKAKVSRDGTDFGDSYVTLVDEGDWGTDKRILVARNIDLTASHDTGTAMKYKIETFNQSAGVKETRIHATSLAWA